MGRDKFPIRQVGSLLAAAPWATTVPRGRAESVFLLIFLRFLGIYTRYRNKITQLNFGEMRFNRKAKLIKPLIYRLYSITCPPLPTPKAYKVAN